MKIKDHWKLDAIVNKEEYLSFKPTNPSVRHYDGV